VEAAMITLSYEVIIILILITFIVGMVVGITLTRPTTRSY
jgi:uncharacterized protein YneF (UPF0154 family)